MYITTIRGSGTWMSVTVLALQQSAAHIVVCVFLCVMGINNSAHLTELLWELNGLTHEKHLTSALEHSVNVS